MRTSSSAGNAGSTLLPASAPKPAVSREISIFWDYENVPLPENCRAAEVSKCIHGAVSQYGRIVDRRLYSDSRKYNAGLTPSNRRFLDSTGFDIVDTPSKGQKETIDKKMIADILSFAWDCTMRNALVDNATLAIQPCVVLITSDGDYAYTLSKLRDRGVLSMVLYGKECTVAQVLVDTADVALSFEKDVLASIKREDCNQCKDSLTTECTSKSSSSASKDSSTESENMAAILAPAEEDSLSGHEQISSAQNISLVAEHDVTAFCNAVQSLQKSIFKKGLLYNLTSIDACWVTDYQAGGYFKNIIRHTTPFQANTKLRFQNARLQALSKGLVEMGRRKMSSQVSNKHIIPVSWNVNPGRNRDFSPEFYLRLTQHGKSYISAWNEAIVQLEQDEVSSLTHIESKDKHQFILSFVPSTTLRGSGAHTDKHGYIQNSDKRLELVTEHLQSAEKTGILTTSAACDYTSKTASDSSKLSDLCNKFDTKVQAADHSALTALSTFGSNVDQNRNTFSNPNGMSSQPVGTYQPQEITALSSLSPDKNLFGLNLVKGDTNTGAPARASTESFNVLSPVLSKTTTLEPTSLSYDNALLIFCNCVKTLQVNSMKNNYGFDFHTVWVTDSSVSQYYKSWISAEMQRASNEKSLKFIDYKTARENAILKGLVKAGRRQLVSNSDSSPKSIVVVNWKDNSGSKHGLSSEVYLRLNNLGL